MKKLYLFGILILAVACSRDPKKSLDLKTCYSLDSSFSIEAPVEYIVSNCSTDQLILSDNYKDGVLVQKSDELDIPLFRSLVERGRKSYENKFSTSYIIDVDSIISYKVSKGLFKASNHYFLKQKAGKKYLIIVYGLNLDQEESAYISSTLRTSDGNIAKL